MVTQVSVWLLAAALGQASTEASSAWLKSVPVEADVVVRCRGVASAAEDVKAMLKAASPNAAATIVPMIEQSIDQWKALFGTDIVDAPVVGLLRAEASGPDGVPPFAILLKKDDYKGVLKALANGKDVATKAEEGGYDSFANPHGGGTWYAFHGEGFTAFGPDKALIAGVAKPGDKSLAAALTPALAAPFHGGDIGIYIDVARLTRRFGQRIDQAREGFMAALDQAAKAAPNGASMDAVKRLYGGLFDWLKTVQALALNLDFAAEGLRIAGRIEVQAAADAKPAETVASVPAEFAKLPPDAAFYMYMNMSADGVQQLQGMSLRMVNPTGKPAPALDRAMERFKGLGRIEAIGSASLADGMRTFNVSKVSDPKAYMEATEAMLQAMKDADGPYDLYKDVKVERDAKNHGGVSFTRITVEFDVDKIAKLGQGGAGAAPIRAMFGGDSMSYWIGIDGDRLIQVTAPTWEEAEARLDRFAKGESAVGSLTGFKRVRSELADKANFLMIVDGRKLTRMATAPFGPAAALPGANEPAEPVFLGASLTLDGPGAYDFRVSLPSALGAVIEKEFIPLIQNVRPQPPR